VEKPTAVPATMGKRTDRAAFSKMTEGSVREGMYVVILAVLGGCIDQVKSIQLGSRDRGVSEWKRWRRRKLPVAEARLVSALFEWRWGWGKRTGALSFSSSLVP
jgi:hypothetical protein